MQFRIQKLDGGVLYYINQHIIKVRSAGRIPLLFFFFFILDLCGMKRIAESFVLCENECLIKPENPHFYSHFPLLSYDVPRQKKMDRNEGKSLSVFQAIKWRNVCTYHLLSSIYTGQSNMFIQHLSQYC